MSPELERFFEAYHVKRTAPPEEKPQRVAMFERLLSEALSRKPGVRSGASFFSWRRRIAGVNFPR